MHDRVVHFYHGTVRVNRVRDENIIAHEVGDPLGDGGFAVAGVAEEHHRGAGVDRGTDHVQDRLVDHQALEGVADVFARHLDILDRLGVDRLDRHRAGAGVRRLAHRSLSRLHAARGQDVLII
jgi:hypothetical protein